MNETDKHRHLVIEYCNGNGVDIGSSGNPVVPWAIQLDLPIEEYLRYSAIRPDTAIHWRGDGRDLPFRDNTLDWIHSSHVLEDFEDWAQPLAEWDRCLKLGGYMIIAVPDHDRFRAAVAAGQGDNCAHKHESRPGELSELLKTYRTIKDMFVNDDPREYSVLYVGQKLM